MTVKDFPESGTNQTLLWQENVQGFVIVTPGADAVGGNVGDGPQRLENPTPGSSQSGIGLVSGWACNAQKITVRFDEKFDFEAAYGTARGDTQTVCGDTNNGFGLLVNWNLLGNGPHTIQVFADGVEFANATFVVTTLGAEFLRGKTKTVTIQNFPASQTDIQLVWQENLQNFVVQGFLPHVENIAPAQVKPGELITVTMTGNHLQDVTALKFEPDVDAVSLYGAPGITVSNLQASTDRITATVTFAANVGTGGYLVSAKSAVGTSVDDASFRVEVTSPSPGKKFTGRWQGTTSQSQPITLTVDDTDTITQIEMNYRIGGAGSGSCLLTGLRAPQTVKLSRDGSFNGVAGFTSSDRSNFATISALLRGSFIGSNGQGSWNVNSLFLICGNFLTIGTGSSFDFTVTKAAP